MDGTDVARTDSKTEAVDKLSPNAPAVADADSQFSSRWAFWLSAIGCSVGFGNLWRFPYLCYTYGGALFFIPYIVAMILIVIPITFLEFGLGQLSQGGNVKAFRAVGPLVANVGWGFLGAANVLQYYPLLLAWSLAYFTNSMTKDLPWAFTAEEKAECLAVVTQSACAAKEFCGWKDDASTCEVQILLKAQNFYYNKISAKPNYWDGVEKFNGFIFLYEFISWALIFLGTVGGAKILGYINYFTTTAPAVFLCILVGTGISLKGSSIGIKQYIGKFELTTKLPSGKTVNNLADVKVWCAATGQALFSMGAAQGTMAGYAAHNQRDQNFVQDTYVVVFGDTMFAFLAGFAVFAVAGFMSKDLGVPLKDLPLSGPGLPFQAYPVGLAFGIPAPWSQILSVMFFMTLWLLGMSTAVGLIEGLCVVVTESKFYASHPQLKRWYAYAFMCSLFGSFAFMYSTDMGSHMLNYTDSVLAVFGYVFVAGIQSFSAGWAAAWELYKRRCGSLSVYIHMGTYVGGGLVGVILIVFTDFGLVAGVPLAVVIILGGFAVAVYMAREDRPNGGSFTLYDKVYNLSMYNIQLLRKAMNDIACKDTIWRVPRVWCFLVKYVIPIMAMWFFCNTVSDPRATFDQPKADSNSEEDELARKLHGAYPIWLRLLCATGPMVVFSGVILFFFFPQWMHWIWPEEEFEFAYEDEEFAQEVDVAYRRKLSETPRTSKVTPLETQTSKSSSDS